MSVRVLWFDPNNVIHLVTPTLRPEPANLSCLCGVCLTRHYQRVSETHAGRDIESITCVNECLLRTAPLRPSARLPATEAAGILPLSPTALLTGT